jgi:hypothetical protein
MSTGRSTMWRRPAAWHAVSGASPVIMTSWWLLSASSRSAGSLSAAQGGAGLQLTKEGSIMCQHQQQHPAGSHVVRGAGALSAADVHTE